MAVNIRKFLLNGNMNNLVSYDKYMSSPQVYSYNGTNGTLIETYGFALPILSQTGYDIGEIGILPNPNSYISRVNLPSTNSECKKYTIEGNEGLVDFTDSSNYHEVIEKQKMVRDLENEILTNSDNITVLKIGDNDTPAMIGLKEAINSKECDINSYESRFEGNFNNDKRILSEDSITLQKLVKFGDAMDMKISITIEDKSESVPNPIGKAINIELTGGE